MTRRRWQLLLVSAVLAAGTLTLAAQNRRPNPGLPAMIFPWNVPPDPVAVPRPTLERLEAGGMPVRVRVESQARTMSATLMARTPPLTGAGRLALAYALRFGGMEGQEGPAFDALLGQLGMRMSVAVSPDALEVTFTGTPQTVLAGDKDVDLLGLLAQRLRNPAFSDELLSRLKGNMQQTLSNRRNDPLLAGLDQLRTTIFQDHPYGMALAHKDAEGLDAKILEELHASTFVPSRCVLSVTGPLEGASVKALAEKAFEGWSGSASGERPGLPRPQESSSVQTLPSPDQRMVAVAGRMVVPANPMERAATRILATALEAALQRSAPEPGRFRVGARLDEQSDASLLWGWVEGANPSSTDAILRQEVVRMGQGGIQPREIEYARARAIAELLRGMTDTASLMRGNARLDLLRGPQPPDAGIAAEIELLKSLPATAVIDMGRALLGRTAVAIVFVAPEGMKLGSSAAPAVSLPEAASGEKPAAAHDGEHAAASAEGVAAVGAAAAIPAVLPASAPASNLAGRGEAVEEARKEVAPKVRKGKRAARHAKAVRRSRRRRR